MSMSCGEFLSPRHNQRVSTYYYCLSLIFQDHKNCHTRRVWVDNSVCMLLTYGESSSTKHDPTPSTYCYLLSLIIHCGQWVQGLRIRCKVVEHPWVVHTASVIGQWYHMKKRTQPWNHDPCLVFCEFFCIQRVLYLAPPFAPGLHWSPGTIYFGGSPAKLLSIIHMEFTWTPHGVQMNHLESVDSTYQIQGNP